MTPIVLNDKTNIIIFVEARVKFISSRLMRCKLEINKLRKLKEPIFQEIKNKKISEKIHYADNLTVEQQIQLLSQGFILEADDLYRVYFTKEIKETDAEFEARKNQSLEEYQSRLETYNNRKVELESLVYLHQELTKELEEFRNSNEYKQAIMLQTP